MTGGEGADGGGVAGCGGGVSELTVRFCKVGYFRERW